MEEAGGGTDRLVDLFCRSLRKEEEVVGTAGGLCCCDMKGRGNPFSSSSYDVGA